MVQDVNVNILDRNAEVFFLLLFLLAYKVLLVL